MDKRDYNQIEELVAELERLITTEVGAKQTPITINTVGLILKLINNLPKEFRTALVKELIREYNNNNSNSIVRRQKEFENKRQEEWTETLARAEQDLIDMTKDW